MPTRAERFSPWDRIWIHSHYSRSSRRRDRARQKIDLLTRIGLTVGPQDTVLDLGCGSGQVTLELARRGARPERWLACDASEVACRAASAAFRRAGLPAEVFHADACRLPLACDTASIVIACGVLEHIPDVGGAVSEIARILRDQGGLMVITSHTNSIVYLERRIREASRLWPYGYQRNSSTADLQRLLKPSFEVNVIESAQTAWDFPLAAAGDRIIGACTERPWGRYLAASCKRA